MKIKIFKYILSVAGLLVVVGGFSIYLSWWKFLHTPLVPAGETIIYIFPEGAGVKDLAADLQRKAALNYPQFLVWLARIKGMTKQLQAGEYAFDGGLLPLQLLEKMRRGEVIQHQITFIEGWNFRQMMNVLENTASIKPSLRQTNPETLMQRLDSQYSSPEGLFFPDTYRYTRNTTDVEILRRAYQKMQTILQQAWSQRDADLPYKDAYQALVVASLVEKEAKLESERALIAGVIVNRLRKKMYLQIDPTVIYALGQNYKGVLSTADMRVQSPYNTYIYKGLPPTPIAMPGWRSIWAALHPQKTDALYFVAKGDGSHYFSKSLEEHEAAIRRYLIRDTKISIAFCPMSWKGPAAFAGISGLCPLPAVWRNSWDMAKCNMLYAMDHEKKVCANESEIYYN